MSTSTKSNKSKCKVSCLKDCKEEVLKDLDLCHTKCSGPWLLPGRIKSLLYRPTQSHAAGVEAADPKAAYLLMMRHEGAGRRV